MTDQRRRKTLLRRWVRALRSGRYEQATGALVRARGYCCLGVACDISGMGEWTKYGYKTSPSVSAYRTWMPKDVAEAFGMSRAQEHHLAGMNDGGNDFEAIANYIENRFINA